MKKTYETIDGIFLSGASKLDKGSVVSDLLGVVQNGNLYQEGSPVADSYQIIDSETLRFSGRKFLIGRCSPEDVEKDVKDVLMRKAITKACVSTGLARKFESTQGLVAIVAKNSAKYKINPKRVERCDDVGEDYPYSGTITVYFAKKVN